MAEGEAGGSRSLRVALLSTCAVSTPPRAYGGTELVVAELARELVKLGHRPTVYATGDSTCAGDRGRAIFDRPVWPPDALAELRHASAAWQEIAARRHEIDIVHANDARSLSFSQFVSLPTIATVHHHRDDSLTKHYVDHPNVSFVGISQRQTDLVWEVPFRAVVHHGLNAELYPFGEGGEACAFLGRFAPEKGPHTAIDAASEAGVPLLVGGDAQSIYGDFFARELAPRFEIDGPSGRMKNPKVDWLGEVGHERKVEMLRRARALLFPIEWEEPFGLVIIESMLVGTPVIAYDCGAVSEIIEEGVTGFIVHTRDEMVARIKDIKNLDRRACRARAQERWSAARMAREYVSVYLDAIDRFRGRHGSGTWRKTLIPNEEVSCGNAAPVLQLAK